MEKKNRVRKTWMDMKIMKRTRMDREKGLRRHRGSGRVGRRWIGKE